MTTFAAAMDSRPRICLLPGIRRTRLRPRERRDTRRRVRCAGGNIRADECAALNGRVTTATTLDAADLSYEPTQQSCAAIRTAELDADARDDDAIDHLARTALAVDDRASSVPVARDIHRAGWRG
jgi:hypothetical protein